MSPLVNLRLVYAHFSFWAFRKEETGGRGEVCTVLTSSSIFITSVPLVCDHPRRATKLLRASGKTPRSRSSAIFIASNRLLSFCLSLPTRRETCPNFGGSQPKALYIEICLDVEDIHSYS